MLSVALGVLFFDWWFGGRGPAWESGEQIPWPSAAQVRQRAMEEHMRVGAEFETIHNHTTYSFGIDDQEFMTAFECDEPSDFMHLMLTLRESEASRYTERDTPIFVGQHVDIRMALDALDGKSARVRAEL